MRYQQFSRLRPAIERCYVQGGPAHGILGTDISAFIDQLPDAGKIAARYHPRQWRFVGWRIASDLRGGLLRCCCSLCSRIVRALRAGGQYQCQAQSRW